MKTNFKRLIILFVLIVANVFSALSQTKPMNEMWGEAAVSVDALKAGRGKHTIKVSLVEGDTESSSLESVYIYPIN